MLRRIGTLAAAAFMATTLVAVIPASPASANNTGTCIGQGIATTGHLYYPGFPLVTTTPNTVGFHFSLMTGVCVYADGSVTTTLEAAGTLTGNCGLWAGSGTTNNGHDFSFTMAGSVMYLTGEVVGVVKGFPDATAGQSCVSGATKFLVLGDVALV